MERAVEWYCAAFGFDVEMAFELPGFRATMLVTTDGMKIELFEADDSTRTTDSSDPRTVMRSQGFTHLALGVDDLDAVHARLLELGARTVWPPQDSPEPGQRMAFIHDPEGNLIELIGSA